MQAQRLASLSARATAEQEVAKVTREIDNVITAISKDMFHASMKARMDTLEADKARLTKQLSDILELEPFIVHPGLADAYARKVADLATALNTDAAREEASDIQFDRARELLRLHRSTYQVFWAWAEANVAQCLLGHPLESVFSWRIQFLPNSGVAINERSILNGPMQAHGAEMIRLAVSMAIEDSLMICAPVHDGLLLEGPVGEIEAQA